MDPAGVDTRPAEEVEALRSVRHPGVVESVEGAIGRALTETGPLTPEQVAGVAAHVAATLADLHDLGIAHGSIDPSHVVLAAGGRPVLCSFGPGGEPADDVAALGRLVSSLLAQCPARRPGRKRWPERRRRLGPMLAPLTAPALAALAAEAISPDPARRPTARALAAAISRHVPSARLPEPEAAAASRQRPVPTRLPARRPKTPPVTALMLTLMLMVLVLGALVVVVRRARSEGEAPRGVSAPVPTPPLDFDGGVLTVDGARYALGQTGDAVVVGDWACTGRPTPVVLRPSSGELFVFADWARPGHDVMARSLGRVEGASGIRTARAEKGKGCHRLEVLRRDGPPAPVDVAP